MKFCSEKLFEKDLEQGVHLAGIGGVGMTALAEMLLDLGIEVTGSDTAASKNVDRLKALGVKIYSTHEEKHVENKLLCRTRAVKDHNPEVLAAKKAVFRSTLLAYLAKGKKQLVVTGSHGKTTTSALLSHCMVRCGFNPSFAVGGLCPSLDRYGRISEGEYFILEGDESDGSHLKTDPFGAILTSCDVDHLAFWKNGEALHESYKKFASMVKSKKNFLYYGEDPYLKTFEVGGKSYGLNKDFDYFATNIHLDTTQSTFTIGGKELSFPMFGEYNIKNAIAVYGLLDSLGVSSVDIIEGFKTFKGVVRRMEYLGKNIYSDYAHHPEEVKSVLHALSKVSEDIAIVFEPHRITRFQDELNGFCKVFKNVVITDVFEASEDTKVDSLPLLQEFCLRTGSVYVSLEGIKNYLSNEKKKVVALTAGSLDKKLREFVEEA